MGSPAPHQLGWVSLVEMEQDWKLTWLMLPASLRGGWRCIQGWEVESSWVG